MKLTEEEQSELLNLMYQSDDEDMPSETLQFNDAPVELHLAGKFVVVSINNKQVSVPNMAYVIGLETKITEQARQISHLSSSLKLLRQAVNKLISKSGDVDRQLANKINLRDFP